MGTKIGGFRVIRNHTTTTQIGQISYRVVGVNIGGSVISRSAFIREKKGGFRARIQLTFFLFLAEFFPPSLYRGQLRFDLYVGAFQILHSVLKFSDSLTRIQFRICRENRYR